MIILPNDFTTLDPQMLPASMDINFCANIFDTLVTIDENMQIVPCLAYKWEVSNDGLTYTFYLEEGVKFHNDEELKASDVVFTVDRFVSEEWMMFASFMIEDAVAVSDYVVDIHLKYPYGAFLGMLNYMFVVNEKQVKEVGDGLAQNPVGTGAYKFVRWDVAQQIVLEAHEDYFQGAPPIKNLIFKIIPDSNTAYVTMETGGADFIFQGISAVDYEQAKTNANLATDEIDGNYFYAANFNMERIGRDVRRALSHAVDRESVNILVNEGSGIVTDIGLIEGQEGYTTDLVTYEYNPDLARRLLAEAGAANLEIDFFYGENVDNNKLAQALQSMFNEVGVSLRLKPVETGTWWQIFGDGDYDMSRGGYPMEDANTDSAYYDMFHKDGTFNISRINDDRINKLLDQARVELDGNERHKLYVQVNQILAEEAYFIPLYFNLSTIIYNPALKNVEALRSKRYLFNQFSW